MPARVARLVVLTMLVGLGCGPSQAQIKRARGVAYQTDFSVVWSAILKAVTKRYRTIAVEDAVVGKMVTDWQLIEKTAGDEGVAGDPTKPGGKFFRVAIDVKGGPPWRVSIDGEAAEYKPGLAMLVPFRHGVEDEPAWVMPRIDALYTAIYASLEQHAVELVSRPAAEATPALDTSRWANLPVGAAEVVAAVEAAASRKDAGALRATMSATFSSAIGDGAPADRTVALWSADPTLLQAVARALGAGCGVATCDPVVFCPATTNVGSAERATFRLADGRWRFKERHYSREAVHPSGQALPAG